MSRTENDSWDLASSVGATATMVAMVRALASRDPKPLINDPYADPLVRAVGMEFFVRVLDGDVHFAAVDDPRFSMSRTIDLLAVRTKFFDDFFTAPPGTPQVVILASGLDSRAYRLAWPAGTVVYEIDQPEVIDFKATTLSQLGASPKAEHRLVAVDLRDDWPTVLRANGFDDSKPTAWSAEGLISYLTPEAQDRLFDNITALSAPGSRLATEYHPDGGAALTERNKVMKEQWGQHGLDLDLSALMYHGDRNPVAEYLTNHGWQVSTQTRAELFELYGREMPDDDPTAPLRNTIAVTAIRK